MIVKLPPTDGRGKPDHRPPANAAQIVPARERGGGAPDFLDLGVPALDRVAGSWRGLRGREAMPSSARLYISDFVAEMTYLVIGYRMDDGTKWSSMPRSAPWWARSYRDRPDGW